MALFGDIHIHNDVDVSALLVKIDNVQRDVSEALVLLRMSPEDRAKLNAAAGNLDASTRGLDKAVHDAQQTKGNT